MGIVALWSAPRSRSTAFFRSMLERDDLLALHEPLEGLAYIGPIVIASETRSLNPLQIVRAWPVAVAGFHCQIADGSLAVEVVAI